MKFLEQRPLLKKTFMPLFSGIMLFIMWIYLGVSTDISITDFFMSGCLVLIIFYTGTLFYIQIDKYD